MELSGVLNYQHNPKGDDLRAETGRILYILIKTVTKKHVKAIIERRQIDDNENLEVMPSESATKRQSDNRTSKENLQEEIEKNIIK